MSLSFGRVLAIIGPTAVGKTALALLIAERARGEIISLDSRLIYRGLDIGTAKPSIEELARVPHHLIDLNLPSRTLSLSEVQSLAYAAVEEVLARGRLPILAGGTGQYVRAVLEGWVIPEVQPDLALRAELEALAEREGPEALQLRLRALDPASAERIDPRNLRRVIRAIEVGVHADEPMSVLQDRSAPPYDFVIASLSRPREALYARIDARLDAMLEAGLEAEVRGLVEAGFGFDLPAMSGLGYGEWRDYFSGTIDRDEVIRLIRRNSRRLVRTQSNWFGGEDDRAREYDLSQMGIEAVTRDLEVRLGIG
jgi:tRNA dimethylallyltransferase